MSSTTMLKHAEPVLLAPEKVREAVVRIAPHIRRTPLLECQLLNDWLGHDIVFKYEGMQKIGAFKIRGALNALLSLREEGRLPRHVVAYSSGNHAQAVALAGKLLDIATTVVMPEFVSSIKQQATRSYGADLRLTQTRQEAEALAAQLAQEKNAYFLHTSANDYVIAGQGTAVLEALEDGMAPDAIFASCGCGGLVSGAWLAAQLAAPQAQVFAAEPSMANDVAQSVRAGRIIGFDDTPMTIADGARTLRITEKTFAYIRQLSGVLEAEEDQIIYWTQWLTHMLKVTVEPTAALAMAACAQWLAGQVTRRRVLVVLSGGNVDAQMHRKIWAQSRLEQLPRL
ncbi:MAG: pyridoxal-phosphate dependent enzyme [Proteobacteria bacterium]|nr:pyridoxal-phosphate dependent enzyme [Pseudomonadota bacterium]